MLITLNVHSAVWITSRRVIFSANAVNVALLIVRSQFLSNLRQGFDIGHPVFNSDCKGNSTEHTISVSLTRTWLIAISPRHDGSICEHVSFTTFQVTDALCTVALVYQV